MRTKINLILAAVTSASGCDIQAAGDIEQRSLASELDAVAAAESSEDASVHNEQQVVLAAISEQDAEPTHQPIDQDQLSAVPDVERSHALCDGINYVSPNRCTWERVTDTVATFEAQCDTGYTPISGGCWTSSSASLQGSMPNAGNPTDGVNDESAWPSGSGWTCEWTAAAGGGTSHYAWALCCGTVQPHDCLGE